MGYNVIEKKLFSCIRSITILAEFMISEQVPSLPALLFEGIYRRYCFYYTRCLWLTHWIIHLLVFCVRLCLRNKRNEIATKMLWFSPHRTSWILAKWECERDFVSSDGGMAGLVGRQTVVEHFARRYKNQSTGNQFIHISIDSQVLSTAQLVSQVLSYQTLREMALKFNVRRTFQLKAAFPASVLEKHTDYNVFSVSSSDCINCRLGIDYTECRRCAVRWRWRTRTVRLNTGFRDDSSGTYFLSFHSAKRLK